MSNIIAVSNQKGGVSKTTTAYNLGACLALNHNKRVLLADIDPQANLTEYCGYEVDYNLTMTSLIMTVCNNGSVSPDKVKSAIRHCDKAGVDFIPSDINLASIETFMSSALSRETILRRILSKEVTKNYDFVIIDCLPSLSTLLINAVSASDKVLIPVQTQKFSLDGLQALESILNQVKITINPGLQLIGVLPTMVDRTKISRNAVETLAEKYGNYLFKTVISKSVDAAKSSETGIPLCATNSKLGIEYETFAMEVLERC
ncbi:MAG: ParA family protein [Ruminococcus sp.]|nr:ParA family protein [Ruminococcus sp.]